MRKSKTLLLGVGNYLMGDEGIGVHVAQRLETSQEIPGIDVVDGGTGGFHLLEFFDIGRCDFGWIEAGYHQVY